MLQIQQGVSIISAVSGDEIAVPAQETLKPYCSPCMWCMYIILYITSTLPDNSHQQLHSAMSAGMRGQALKCIEGNQKPCKQKARAAICQDKVKQQAECIAGLCPGMAVRRSSQQVHGLCRVTSTTYKFCLWEGHGTNDCVVD